jgi:integrase
MGRGKGVRAASASSIGITFQYRGARCREKLRLPPNEANKKYAERLKATIELEIAKGIFDYAKHFPNSKRARTLGRQPGAVQSVKDGLRDWHKLHGGSLEPETAREYFNDIENTLIPQFGDYTLAGLPRDDVLQWVNDSALSAKRLRNILIPLRQMYDELLSGGKVLSNPLARLKIRKPEQVKDDPIDPFSPKELSLIVEHSPAELADMFAFWAWTGLRIEELIAITWNDVDFVRNVVRITKAVRDGRLKGPKTKAGRREVMLQEEAIAALKRQKARTFLAGKEVWLHINTREPWKGDESIRRPHWTRILKTAGVRYRYPNQLRHTFASWMLSCGENPQWVAKQMGHKDWSVVVKHYARWMPQLDQDAGKRASGIIRQQM